MKFCPSKKVGNPGSIFCCHCAFLRGLDPCIVHCIDRYFKTFCREKRAHACNQYSLRQDNARILVLVKNSKNWIKPSLNYQERTQNDR